MARKKDSWGAAVGDAPWARLLAPAPGDLRIVQALVNSRDLATGRDELASPEDLSDWLARWHLVPPETTIGEREHARTLAVRDGLRAVVGARRGGAPDRDAVARLDAEAEGVMLRVRFDAAGTARHEPAAGGLDGALARLLHVVAIARVEGQWHRLKLCANEGCRRAYYDASRNLIGKWCSMRRCGGRAKSRTWRRRHPDRVY